MRKALIILFLFISLACQAETYYVKNGGSDVAAGTSDATAWAYCPGMTSWAGSATLSAGDSILFKRGDTWRMQVINSPGGSVGNYVYFGVYGSGNNPIFYGSKEENNALDWNDLGSNIWSNKDASFTTEVGNIVFNNTSCGTRCMTSSPLPDSVDAQGDWWYDAVGDSIILYSVNNPATVYTDIECCLALDAINREALLYTVFQNLDFRCWAGYGCYMQNGSNYNQFYDLDMSFIGGMLYSSSSRQGNGITCYRGASNVTVERCYITQVFDAGISPQGPAASYAIDNWIMRNNIITYCEMGFEYWIGTGATADSIIFENNTCLYNGWGFARGQRGTGSNVGCDVIIGISPGTETNIIIRNNIFAYSYYKPYHFSATADVNDVTIDYNCVTGGTGPTGYYAWLGSSVNKCYTFTAWQTNAFGPQDANSEEHDPQLEGGSPYSFIPKVTSWAIDHGYNNGLAYDFRQYARSVPIDIGAYEFNGAPVTGTFVFGKDTTGVFLKNANGQFIILSK